MPQISNMPHISKIGYCRYQMDQVPENWKGTPTEISNGYAVQFDFDYKWNDTNTKCTLSNLQWAPGEVIFENGTRVFKKGITFSTDGFKQPNLTITVNDKSVLQSHGIIYQQQSLSEDPEPFSSSITTNFLTVDFSYSYTDNNNITYSVIIPDIKILKASKYERNVVFTYDGINELLEQIKNYPITSITEISDTTTWDDYTQGKPCLKVTYGNTTKEFSGYKKADGSSQTEKTIGFQYIPVGSNITFPEETLPLPDAQTTGTIRIKINEVTHEIPVQGLVGQGDGNITLNGTTVVSGHLLPNKDAIDTNNGGEWNIGSSEEKWHTGYFKNIYVTTGKFDTINIWDGQNTDPKAYIDLSTYINNAVTYDGDHPLEVTNTTNGVTPDDITSTSYSGNSSASIHTAGGIYATKDIWARRVFNAVFNDYAECRTTIDLTPGHVVIDQDDGSLKCSFARLQPGAQIISDTYGHLMGSTETAKTPIAVAGRVLVYTYQPRKNYHAGMAVCSAPDGTVDIMTREEIRDYPDCIIGIVSEIPQYETWGSNNVKVDGRIWIKVK